MASPSVLTPIKGRNNGLFNPRLAGGRMALQSTPSPRTPSRDSDMNVAAQPADSIYAGTNNLMSKFSRSVSKTSVRDSPKSNIARGTNSPRKLELGVSNYTLTGTGHSAHHHQHAAQTPGRSSRRGAVKTPTRKKDAADRFIPTRIQSDDMFNVAAGRLDIDAKPKSSRPNTRDGGTAGSSVLANAASRTNNVFNIAGGRAADDPATLSLEGLSLNDNDDGPANGQNGNGKQLGPDGQPLTPNSAAYQSSLAQACGVNLNTRILAFKPAPPESSKSIDLRSQYNRPLKPAAAASGFRRRVGTTPERVLDAPGLVDDYYLNLLDWSVGNQVAIGLERSVYIWSADSGAVNPLLEAPSDTYIASLKWSQDGAYVGVGLGTGEVQIWDVEEQTRLRSMLGHEARVSSLGWNKHLLSTGGRSGAIFNHDVRIAQHKVAELNAHEGEVCGLEWRPSDGAQLASGANDNLVCIWDARSLTAPKFTKTNHKAAVKAVAWCPWHTNLLATGGGSHDRQIHFWNTTTGARTNSIETGSQVTALRWSTAYKEIVSCGGFPDNSLSIWSYPNLVKNFEIPAHDSRVLHATLSPDGEMLATAAADESLKFWKLFEKKPAGATASRDRDAGSKKSGMKAMTIR
ncbi:WD40-repeat-containing domain protein [Lineolata rhizophorae]|uniref:WD40-repeat-containing domain protein n=1 Tax=Lineolata rhizophorae TaxID=578093 RepID=A0A6A6NPB6_9PEZI|nr:WD40-repeat-containing domain protein [Lineolata rhizophorae]